jgi:uracil-DNA glycosylase
MDIPKFKSFLRNNLPNDWLPFFNEEVAKPYFATLFDRLATEYDTKICYPSKANIFRAFSLTSFSNLKGVLLGQDPYHNGTATGLAFSANSEKLPASLFNVFNELELEYDQPITKKANIEGWAKQGLLMLNCTLTVEKGKPNSHLNFGWQFFSDNLLKFLSKKDNLFYFLWGNNAKAKLPLITNASSAIFTASHPSPLAGKSFIGNGCFKKANDFLLKIDKETINWFNF